MKKKAAKDRDRLSKKRQSLWKKLGIMEQRVRDMAVAGALGAEGTKEKLSFCEQEIAKLKAEIKSNDLGVSRQRAWIRGKEM